MIGNWFNRNVFLVGIVVLALFLRFFELGTNPPSLTWDEVAWGYNAYSIGIDGKDEFGKMLPTVFLESFGDYKPPVYVYFDVLPIKLFGLNEFAVRFPSALFGVLTVLITYFLTKRIFNDKFKVQSSKLKVATQNSKLESIALLSAFFLAISPWHINLSRAAFEANVATFFIVFGVWSFMVSMQERRWLLIISMLSFVLSMHTFNTARVVSTLLAAVLAVGFRKELFQNKKYVAISMVVAFLLIFPLAQFLQTPQAKLRFEEVNIFSDVGLVTQATQQMENDGNAWWSNVIHNRRVFYTIEYLRHYFDNFNPSFLFIKGDGNPKFSIQDVGQLYLWELPFFIGGIFLLFRKRIGKWWIVPLWLIISIIPAATARETPHALRIEGGLPTYQIFTAIGVVAFLSHVARLRYRTLLFFLITFLIGFNFLYYYYSYHVDYPRIYSGEWQYGYKEAIAYTEQVKKSYDVIVFTEALGRPYIYVLFYGHYSPENFRNSAKIEREVFGFVHVPQFEKYHFQRDVEAFAEKNKKILYVNVPKEVPAYAKIVKRFFLLNGKPSLVAYTIDR